MVLTVSFALSLVTWLFCHHHPQVHHLADLISASGYQDHTTLPSAEAPLVLRRRRVHRIPRPTSVTTRTPLKWEQDGGDMDVIWAKREAEYF